jgi:hypothetical protein
MLNKDTVMIVMMITVVLWALTDNSRISDYNKNELHCICMSPCFLESV